MSTSPNTSTIFDGEGLPNSQTRTGLSTQIAILVDGQPVGAIQSFGATQQRQTRPVMEVGTDGVIEIVPSGSTTISLSIQRIVFDGLSLPEAFMRGFTNIAAQRIPFDIVAVDRFSSPESPGTPMEEEPQAIVTVYKNCWFTNLAKTYTASDYIISENASVSCETVYTTKGERPLAGLGHDIGATAVPKINDIEQRVDSGEYRGSMSSQNIVNATY